MKNFGKFIYNSYGNDDLNNFLFRLYFIVFILNIFFISSILNCFEIILVCVILFRFFSKNKFKRGLENRKYLNIRNNIFKYISGIKYKDGFIYKRCPKCKKLLKFSLPYKRGIKRVICPKCKKKFRMLVLKREKIEIISNK